MKAIVIYESLTGTTRTAAGMIAARLAAQDVTVTGVYPVGKVDLQALSDADVVVVGTWTDGIFVVAQRPAKAGKLEGLPAMRGKRAVAYATYAINPGKTVEKLMAILERRGAEVVGGLALHRGHLERDVDDFVDRLLTAVTT